MPRSKAYKDSHIGETSIHRKSNQIMTIIAYNNAQDIAIQFHDGTIVEHAYHSSFKNGTVSHPGYPKSQRDSRIGEIGKSNDNHVCKIIKYRNSSDVTVQFEDGAIVEHRPYREFKMGSILHPNMHRNAYIANLKTQRIAKQRIGKTNVANNGMNMTIIGYRASDDIDIQFEDGIIVTNKRYASFRTGEIAHPSLNTFIQKHQNRVGESRMANNGLMMTITAYRGDKDIDIRFADGTVVEHRNYNAFKLGQIARPTDQMERTMKKMKDKYLGLTITAINGLRVTISEYYPGNFIDVTFETGYVSTHRQVGNFKSRQIKHPFPYEIGNVVIDKPAYIHDDIGNFYCHCPHCGLVDIMDMNEIKNHKCERKESIA